MHKEKLKATYYFGLMFAAAGWLQDVVVDAFDVKRHRVPAGNQIECCNC
jgi:hypothetical protein